jgi:hypothetical protein
MNLLNWFFKQVVQHSDMLQFQSNVDAAQRQGLSDMLDWGVVKGGQVLAHTTNKMTVDSPSPSLVYDVNGQRMYWGSAQNVNCAVDVNGVATVPVSLNTDRWLSVYAIFSRNNYTPKIDGNGTTIQYNEDASFTLKVLAGTAAATGTAARVTDPGDGSVLLGDILVNNSTVAITNTMISYSRVHLWTGSLNAAQLGGQPASYYAAEHSFDVTKYGAKGDGTTDDTTAIASAITAAAAVNGVVLVPATANFYKVTTLTPGTVAFAGTGQIKVGSTVSYYNGGAKGSAAPTAGVWRLGDRVYNSAPAFGAPSYWECAQAGMPGVWIAQFINNTGMSDYFAFDVSSSTGFNYHYLGGICRSDNGFSAVSAGYTTLAASSTNYVELDASSGSISSNTSGFTSGKVMLGVATTDGSGITGTPIDKRTFVVDTSEYVKLAGGTMGGPLILSGDASNALGAVTLQQLTNASLNLQQKASVRLVTTAALPSYTYAAGVMTSTATGLLTIDGKATALNDRVLIIHEATPSNNGWYTVTATGSGTAVYVLTRTTDANTSAKITTGDATLVDDGSAFKGSYWAMLTASPITLDTTSLVFTQINQQAVAATTTTPGVVIVPTSGGLAVDSSGNLSLAQTPSPAVRNAIQSCLMDASANGKSAFMSIGTLVNMAPTNMTSDSTPSPYVASASAEGAPYYAWNAFTGLTTLSGLWQTQNPTGWIKIDLGASGAVAATKVSFGCDPTTTTTAPKNFAIEGSNTGAFAGEQTALSTQTGVTWTIGVEQSFTFANSTAFRYYRINITANTSGPYTALINLQIYAPTSSITAVKLLATAAPLALSFANGLNADGTFANIPAQLGADVAAYWGGGTASSTNYLFVSRNAGTGVLAATVGLSAQTIQTVPPLTGAYGPNLATGKTAIASSGSTGTVNLNDGSTTTVWYASQASANQSGASYAGIDFGAGVTKAIRQIGIFTETTASNNITSVLAQYSDDGITWTTEAAHALATTVSTWLYIALSGGGSHRYWRILANANLGSTYSWDVYEIQMMESNTPSGYRYYDPIQNKAFIYDGTIWIPEQCVAVGECVVDPSGNVTSYLPCVPLCRFDSGSVACSASTLQNVVHGIGHASIVIEVFTSTDNTTWTPLAITSYTRTTVTFTTPAGAAYYRVVARQAQA